MATGLETVPDAVLDRLDDQAVRAEIRARNLSLRDGDARLTPRRAGPARAPRRAEPDQTAREPAPASR